MTDPGEESPYGDWILRALRRIIRAVDLYSRQLASRHGLTAPQLVCLRQLAQSSEPLSPGKLARRVSLSPATITGIVDRLEKRSLVERERSFEDRRQIWVRITEAGRTLVRQAPPPLNERFLHRLALLPEHEQAEIERNLDRIVRMMEAGDIDAAPLLSSGPPTADFDSVSSFLFPAEGAPAAADVTEQSSEGAEVQELRIVPPLGEKEG